MPAKEMDFFTRSDIEGAIWRIDQLLNSGVFHPKNSGNVFLRAAFVELLIALRDLMFKAGAFANRISFSDDVRQTEVVKDVTDLIKYVRDAICHPDSDNNFVENASIKSAFNVAFGKATIMKVGEIEISSKYTDDVCFFFGSQGIYLQRHIVRAFKEARELLEPVVKACKEKEMQAMIDKHKGKG